MTFDEELNILRDREAESVAKVAEERSCSATDFCDKPLARSLRGAVALRYRAYVTVLRDLSPQSLPARLAGTLIRVADGLGAQVEHGDRCAQAVNAIVTQTDLGLMAREARGRVKGLFDYGRE